MPKTCDLDFVDRLLKAIDFFVLENEFDIKESIHKSLCQKFAEDDRIRDIFGSEGRLARRTIYSIAYTFMTSFFIKAILN
uniref:Uncharacterized protein n=1 Tax=Panagrolaimus sp. PS1159 TaxID=55785 RepID=A0AC35G6I7_9BILA